MPMSRQTTGKFGKKVVSCAQPIGVGVCAATIGFGIATGLAIQNPWMGVSVGLLSFGFAYFLSRTSGVCVCVCMGPCSMAHDPGKLETC